MMTLKAVKAKVIESRAFISILALVCLACTVVINEPQLKFFVADWKEGALELISYDNALDLVTSNSGLSDANAAATPVASIANASPPGYAIEKAIKQPKAAYEKSIMIPSMSVNTTVIAWEGWKSLENFMYHNWNRNVLCEHINKERNRTANPSLPITANMTFGCKELFQKSCLGTGNYITALYGIRLVAQVYENVDIHFTCPDAITTKKELILPWLTGWFPPRRDGSRKRFPMLKVQQACVGYGTLPTAFMYNEIRHDFRRMAIGLVGVPQPDHPSAHFAEKYLWSDSGGGNLKSNSVYQLSTPQRDDDPVFPPGSVELDDAVVHFRCGDLMNSNHGHYSFLKFSTYTKNISPDVRTIGIVTQPFEINAETARLVDTHPTNGDRCRIVVTSFLDYIQELFPNAIVRIHNGPRETSSLAYARMVMANQTIAGISSFGVFPVLASFGTGYLHLAAKGPANWVRNPRIDEMTDNVILIDESQVIMVGALKEMWDASGKEGVLEWFWNDTVR